MNTILTHLHKTTLWRLSWIEHLYTCPIIVYVTCTRRCSFGQYFEITFAALASIIRYADGKFADLEILWLISARVYGYYNTYVLKSIFLIYGLVIVINVIRESLNIIKMSACDSENLWLCNDIIRTFEWNCQCVYTPSPSWTGARIRFGQVFWVITWAIDGMRVSPLLSGNDLFHFVLDNSCCS